jgi:protein SCO1/2
MRRLLSFCALALCGVVLVACSSSGSDNPSIVVSSPAKQGFTGATFQPAKLLPHGSLTDTASGKRWDLVTNGGGKVTVIYFGYTKCPDACPTDMAAMARAISQLTPEQQKKVQVVFITVDPKRDTRPVMNAWLRKFDKRVPPFVGLTGTESQLTDVAHRLGMQFKVTSEPSGLEEVEHSSQLTAFDMTGTANLVWLDPPVPSDIAHDLRLLLSGVTPA